MGSCLISTLWLQRATDHGAYCRLVPSHKTGWRLVEPPRSRYYQLTEYDGNKCTREMNEWMNVATLWWAQLVLGQVTFCGSVCNQPPRLTQPSILCETVKWVSALKLSNNNKWRRWVCRWWQPTGRLTAQVSYLGLRVGGCLAVWIHWMNQVNSHGLAMMHYKYWHYYYYFGPRYILSRGSLKIDKKIQNWVRSPVCAVCNWQTRDL